MYVYVSLRNHNHRGLTLFRVILEMEALGLDKLLEAKSSQCLTLARVLVTRPCEILHNVSASDDEMCLALKRTGLG